MSNNNGQYQIIIPSCMSISTDTFTITKENYLTVPRTYDIGYSNTIDFTIMPFCEWGDVDYDNQIAIVDAYFVARCYGGLMPCFEEPCRADVNCDGDINIVDALLIAKYYIKIIDKFPCQR